MGKIREIMTGAVILAGAVAVIWAFMIRPYTYDWQAAGEVNGTVKTLMSNSNVLGGAYIQAVVTLENGQQTIVRIPMEGNIRAGRDIVLSVQQDADNPKRQRYDFKGTTRVE